MRRLFPVVVLALLVASGCKKKATPEPVETGPQFVELSLDDFDMDDLLGVELMQATAECGDLRALEPSAMMGRLSDGQIRCLDQLMRDAERQTVRDRISRVLMADAWGKRDLHRWEGVVRRHLNEIDRSDPDLCFKFASYLARRGPQFADETMHWVQMAMENRSQWQGDLHVQRVNMLYRLRTLAAHEKWEWLAARYASDPTPALLDEMNRTRDSLKEYAREWLEYARSSDRDDSVALQLCVVASGSAAFCEN